MSAELQPYPAARRSDFKETLHGIEVPDPYRWMEDIDSPETRTWVEAESAHAEAFLSQLPARDKLRARLKELWDYEKIGMPTRKAGRVFYSTQSGLQNQPVLVWRPDGSDAEPTVLLDPNTLSDEGTVALSGLSIHDDGKLIAYGLSKAGSDWEEWRVRDVETGKDLDDHLRWVKFSGASWKKGPDAAKAFCYSRFDAPKEGEELSGTNYFQKLFLHRLGEPQEKDTLLYERPDQKKWNFSGGFTEDGKYLVVDVFTGDYSTNGIFYKDLAKDDNPVVEWLAAMDAQYEYVGNDGTTFYVLTTKDAPRSRLVAIDLADSSPEKWRDLIPEGEHRLEGVSMIGDTFAARYLVDAKQEITLFDREGKRLREVALDGPASVSGFNGDRKDRDTYYTLTGFNRPPTIYHYDLATGKSTLYRKPSVNFDPDQFETRQVFYKSKDGTRVPMFISHKKGLAFDQPQPTLLYAYGGFNISLTPRFSLATIAWMEQGGVFAQPNLRGGGEYGEDWHTDGNLLKKQNVFDDFIAAAEWLIAEGITCTPKLAIDGRSNGGLLTGACLTQRPDLYGAVLSGVGVQDMLRFDKFTIGWAWKGEYGDPAHEADFKNLLAYSPYHNVKKGTKYPPILVTTGDHDDRVFPAHSFKFGAALQWAQAAPNPVIVRIDINAGHGAGKPTAKQINEVADTWAFLLHALK